MILQTKYFTFLSQFVSTEQEEGGIGQMLPFFIIIIALLAIFYFLMLRPQKRRQKEQDELIRGLKRGDRVVTSGGIFGEIERIEGESVVLKLEGGTKLRILKSNIAGKQEHG